MRKHNVRLFSLVFILLTTALSFLCYTEQPTTNIQTIVFDFGGVVAKADDTRIKTFLMNSFKIDRKELGIALKTMREKIGEDISEEDYWKRYATSRGIQLPNNWFLQYSTIITESIEEIPGSIAIVKALQARKYQTAMLSDVTQKQTDIIRQLGYYDLFNPVILSCDTGIKKPNSKAFQVLLQRLNQSPSAVLFIDDRIENVEAAKKEGIDSIQFISPKQLKQELEERGIECNSESFYDVLQ